MLDIKFIRENKDLIEMGAKKKHIDFDVSALLKVDDKRIEMLKMVEEKRAKQNEVSKILPQASPQEKEKLISEMAVLKAELNLEEEKLKEIMKEWQTLMLAVPNIPDITVPEGEGEEQNVVSKEWGEKPNFDFEPKDHIEIMTNLKMVDFERGVKAHGFRGYYLMGDGALLSWAIWNYARDFFLKNNFIPFIAPAIVNKEHFYGTGHLPKEADDLFQTQDGQCLSGTAEVPMMAYHSDEILNEKELPKKYLAFSPCYRREAGSHSKDIKGLIRVHEFYKWEQLILCKASHEESDKLFEEINSSTEEFIETLGLPYRRLTICTGDLSASKVKQYDIELWVPKESSYREIGSSSYYHDFQTRRFGTRYKDSENVTRYTHSMNATAIPTPRILVSLIENCQTADGKIKIPKVLQPYMGGREIIG